MTGDTVTDTQVVEPDKWEKRFFPNARLARIEIELFEQDLTEMREYLGQGTFQNENEGWRYLLGTGYAYLRGKERLLLPDGSGVDPEGLAENLRRQVEIESMYAVLKQRAYVWMKDNQTMDMQTGALHTLASGYRALSDRLQEENAALKAEIAQLRAQLAQSAECPLEAEAPAVVPTLPEPPAAASWWQRHLKRTR
jgi:hypothetical protein